MTDKKYMIKGSTLEGLADSVRAINKTEDKMSVAAMKEELDKVPAMLENGGEKIIYTEEFDGPFNIPMDLYNSGDFFEYKASFPTYDENLYQLNKNQDNQVELTKINYLESEINPNNPIVNAGFNAAISQLRAVDHAVVDLGHDMSRDLNIDYIDEDEGTVFFAFGAEGSDMCFIPKQILESVWADEQNSVPDSLQILEEKCGDILLFTMDTKYLASVLEDAGYTVTKS